MWAVLDVKFTWLYQICSLLTWFEVLLKQPIFNSAFFIKDRRKIRRFVFKIMDVTMHAKQALLTLLNNVQRLPFGLKSSLRFFFFFSFVLVVNKIIHFLMARRRSNYHTNSQRRRLVGPAAGPFWEGWTVTSTLTDWAGSAIRAVQIDWLSWQW